MTQKEALEILKSGANVFLTGAPGSGKTHTINQYIRYLQSHDVGVAVTASTGIAATHIGGRTLHSWSGIGIRSTLTGEDLTRMSGQSKIVSRIRKPSVLIIEEVSMLDAQVLDTVESVCRKLRQNPAPWGGLQVVFVGDFFQLPPIVRQGDPDKRFAYEAAGWSSANPVVVYLSEQYRQDDQSFLSMLGSIRSGEIDDTVYELLQTRLTQESDLLEDQTALYSHNLNVDQINERKLTELSGDEQQYIMDARGAVNVIQQLKRGCLSPETLRLKVGAKVMFTKNSFEDGFVNGTTGVVERFSTGNLPIVRIKGGRTTEVQSMEWSVSDGSTTLGRIFQLPLRLAWAITVHKSQGMTLDSAVVDLSKAFEYGQGYVALSRVRSLETLYLIGYNQRSLEVHPEILEQDQLFQQQSARDLERWQDISAYDKQKAIRDFILSRHGSLEERDITAVQSDESQSKDKKESTQDKTLALWRSGKSLAEIAEERSLVGSTVLSHLTESYMAGKLERSELRKLASPELIEALPEIKKAFVEHGRVKLKPVFEQFAEKYSYNDLRLARYLLDEK
jgi:hypothetical protein